MAILDPKPYPVPAGIREQDALLRELTEASANLPDGQIVGAVLSWQIADGYAHYIVTRAEPLTIAHLPVVDQWSVNPILIKGLDAGDVRDDLARQQRLRELFASRQR